MEVVILTNLKPIGVQINNSSRFASRRSPQLAPPHRPLEDAARPCPVVLTVCPPHHAPEPAARPCHTANRSWPPRMRGARRSAQGGNEGVAQGGGEAGTSAGTGAIGRTRRGSEAAPRTRYTEDGTGGGGECGLVDRQRGECRPAAVGAVGGRQWAVPGVEGRRGVGGGRGHQRWQRRWRAGEVEELGSGREKTRWCSEHGLMCH
jgi:hypothetical protein